MSYLSDLRATKELPASHYELPFMERLRHVKGDRPTRHPVQVVSDWLRDNEHRFIVVKAGHPTRPEYRETHRPEPGREIGVILDSKFRHALSDTYMVFTNVFDTELVPLLDMKVQQARRMLKERGYLRHEQNRMTATMPPGLVSARSYGATVRRVVALEKRLLEETV
ncbi:hypothetical protein [Tropicimonas sp. IMCC6043]|uniref:hypothetical protein n=1 Tax=Tropicimonas sp. IMCC6043 TaxID=2510645 RepID=UPI00101B9D06|nr:hypothetical protein [Tropicimonas sp. IMCC6043]RYH07774.1 hypothetical protein EU800_18790 [Tropicimonas sp. IMCC6043]